MIRLILADDEELARRRLERLAGALPEVEIVALCATAEAALAAIREEPADLALLDIDMPGLSGLDVAALRGPDGPAVVFVTAHPQHALAAFGVGATDYLLKPLDPERLARALARVRPRPSAAPEPLAIPTARGLRLLRPAELSHAVLDGETLLLHTADGVIYSSLTLGELERRLPAGFLRVSRRALIAIDALSLLAPAEDGGAVAHLRGGAQVAVSRASARALRRRWGVS